MVIISSYIQIVTRKLILKEIKVPKARGLCLTGKINQQLFLISKEL